MKTKELQSEKTLLEKAESGDLEAQYQIGLSCLGQREVIDDYSREHWWKLKSHSPISEEKYNEGIAISSIRSSSLKPFSISSRAFLSTNGVASLGLSLSR